MKIDEIINTIRRLSLSCGRYGELLHSIRELECTDPERFAKLTETLEAQNFSTGVDVVLYFEQ